MRRDARRRHVFDGRIRETNGGVNNRVRNRPRGCYVSVFTVKRREMEMVRNLAGFNARGRAFFASWRVIIRA